MANLARRFLHRLFGRISTGDLLTSFLLAIGGICVAVVGNTTYALLAGDDRLDPRHVIVAGGAALGALILFRHLVPRVRGLALDQLARTVAGFQRQVPRRRGLIAAVSRKDAPDQTVTAIAIQYHLGQPHPPLPPAVGGDRLEHCWLLATPEVKETANKLQEMYAQTHGLRCEIMELQSGSDAPKDDPVPTYHVVKAIRELARAVQLDTADLIADITGGTKAISIGIFQACAEVGIPMEYIVADYTKEGTPIPRAVIAFEPPLPPGAAPHLPEAQPVAAGRGISADDGRHTAAEGADR